MSSCFVDQIATPEILLRVTNVCGICYDDLIEGDTIYYDMHSYRYLCKKCYEVLSQKLNDDCEVIEDEGLFG